MNFALGVFLLWLGSVAWFVATRPGALTNPSPSGIYKDLLAAIGEGHPIPTVAESSFEADAPSANTSTAGKTYDVRSSAKVSGGKSGVPVANIQTGVQHSYLQVPYANEFRAAGERYQIDPALLAAIGRQESNYNAKAVSSAGAQGVMQLMPFNVEKGHSGFNAQYSIMRGAQIFANNLKIFKGDVVKALEAYNVGPHGNLASAKHYADSVLSWYAKIKAKGKP